MAEEVDEAAVLSEHRHGWLLHPKNGGASPIQILGEADDLWDLTIAFGRGDARIELGFSEKVNPDDELRQLEDICRAIVAGRLSEKRKRKGQSRWQITLMNGKSAPRVCELGLPSDALDSNE
ncbi:MAG TPA: hypothetical protein VK988_21690 [Acidimicrobiales bacterium]|nr:hypothetical protein [Acidimicrobiales bacterium]